jgi:thiamine biosynthesis lipoprotein
MLFKKLFYFFSLVLIAFLIQFTIFCSDTEQIYKEQFPAMSTYVNILVAAKETPDWQKIKNFMESQASLYDHRLPQSPIYQLNHMASGIMPSNLLEVIKAALLVAEKSGGAFDPTVYPLVELWSFDTGGRLPDPQEIERVLPFIDFHKVRILPGNKVTIAPGMGLDLGGVAKGAVVDELSDYFKQKGYTDYLIDAGGDLLLSGRKPDGKPWKVAIRHPWYNREQTDGGVAIASPKQFIGFLELDTSTKKMAIVTSGNYERFFIKDGKRYHHIFDPKTGYPAGEVVSVTVIAENCTLADALSTAAFVLGFEKGPGLVEQFPGAEALLLREKNGSLEAVKTQGFPLKLEDLTL